MAGRHTFLFTDLVGFTALAASQGDDRAADVALEFYERVRPLLVRHGAEQVKAIGDALMLRCDDPAAAVRLGLDIVETLEEVDGFPPVRVGVYTGPTVSRAGDWYGTTVNVAARLCAAAAGGQVLVGEATAEAAGRLKGAALGERRLHWLKNVTEPIGAQLATTRRSCPVEGRLRKLKGLLPAGPQEAIP
jgi:adenylate cyclase